MAVAGQAVQFLRDNLGVIKNAKECSDLAAECDDVIGRLFLFLQYFRELLSILLNGIGPKKYIQIIFIILVCICGILLAGEI